MSFGGLALGYGDYPARIKLLGSVYGRRGGAGRRWAMLRATPIRRVSANTSPLLDVPLSNSRASSSRRAARSTGRRLSWRGGEVAVEDAATADYTGLHVVLFSA